MPDDPTLDDDLARAREILQRGRAEPPDLPMPEHVHFDGAIRHGDTYAAAKLLERFVAEIERLRQAPAVVEAGIELRQFYGLFSDVEAPCTSFAQAFAIWHDMKARLYAEIARLRARVQTLEASGVPHVLRRLDAADAEIARLRELIDALGLIVSALTGQTPRSSPPA